MKAPGNVLILGGTRFVGPWLVREAQRRGHHVTIFHRGETNAPDFDQEVHVLHGDRVEHDLKTLHDTTWDIVIDTCAYFPRVVRQALEVLAPNISHYLFVSTVSVYDEPDAETLTEESKTATTEDESSEEVAENYGALKVLCEKEAASILEEHQVPLTIVRPGLIVGPHDHTDRFMYWVERLSRGGDVLAPGDGLDPVNFIDVRDFATFCWDLLESKTTGTFNVAGPKQRMLMKEFLEILAQTLKTTSVLHWAPTAFLEEQEVGPWVDMPCWIPRDIEEAALCRVSSQRALDAGLYITPLATTVEETFSWWMSLPQERRQETLAGISQDREIQLLDLLVSEATPD